MLNLLVTKADAVGDNVNCAELTVTKADVDGDNVNCAEPIGDKG